jgi:hydroxyethylthiazole kinase
MFKDILESVKDKTPLVHNITNYVTVNDCANMLIACGGSPIMADDLLEVEDITSICDALVINIGTLNARTIESMLKAGKKANELKHTVVLDPVGAGASKLRTDTTFKLLNEIHFSVIRGNISEIKTVSQGSGSTKGVDADVSDTVTDENVEDAVQFAKDLSKKTGSVIAITGAIDIVADAQKAYVIRNGHYMMSKISGTGCMLTSIIGAFCAAYPQNILDATATAVCAMGICGELAFERMQQNDAGTSSLKMYLIDFMSKISPEILKEGAKIEIR